MTEMDSNFRTGELTGTTKNNYVVLTFSGAEHVNGLIAAGSFGGASVKINVDEVGIIGGSYCPVDTLFSSDKSYWNVAASLWGYYYGELARLGSTAIAASQLTGYPPNTWKGIVMPDGRPVDNNFPCVSMMDWRGNGLDMLCHNFAGAMPLVPANVRYPAKRHHILWCLSILNAVVIAICVLERRDRLPFCLVAAAGCLHPHVMAAYAAHRYWMAWGGNLTASTLRQLRACNTGIWWASAPIAGLCQVRPGSGTAGAGLARARVGLCV